MVQNLEQVARMELYLEFFSPKLANKPLTVVGDGNQTRDFLHVNDLVNLLIKIVKSKVKGKIYNVAGVKKSR